VSGALLGAAGCSSDSPSALRPKGPVAGRISALSWFMFGLSGLITLVVFGLMVRGLFSDGEGHRFRMSETRWIALGGVAMPAVVLLALSGLTVTSLHETDGPEPGSYPVEVIGHQYWWEVRYPQARGGPVTAANEIHIPAGRNVRFTLRSVDVIHSLWVPELGGKTDLVPGRTNHLTLKADHPGTFRGQCAEYCGLQHANMAFLVIAETPGDFQRWLSEQAAPAADPGAAAGPAAAGRRDLEQLPCAGCHTVRGTAAAGKVGPDLTHFGSRRTLAALTQPNTPPNVSRWIADAQAVKPGARMPPIALTDTQVSELVAYLRALR